MHLPMIKEHFATWLSTTCSETTNDQMKKMCSFSAVFLKNENSHKTAHDGLQETTTSRTILQICLKHLFHFLKKVRKCPTIPTYEGWKSNHLTKHFWKKITQAREKRIFCMIWSTSCATFRPEVPIKNVGLQVWAACDFCTAGTGFAQEYPTEIFLANSCFFSAKESRCMCIIHSWVSSARQWRFSHVRKFGLDFGGDSEPSFLCRAPVWSCFTLFSFVSWKRTLQSRAPSEPFHQTMRIQPAEFCH